MLLTDLPVEVLELIAAYLKGDPGQYELPQNRHERLADGRALALACRRTHQLGLGVLYSRVDVNDEIGFAILAALRSSSELRHHVISLTIQWYASGNPTPSILSIFPDLARLRVLTLSGSDMLCVQCLTALAQRGNSTNLHKVALDACGHPDGDFLSALVACLPSFANLEQLEACCQHAWNGAVLLPRQAVLPPHVIFYLSDTVDAAPWFSCLDASRLRSLQYHITYAQGVSRVAFFAAADTLEDLLFTGAEPLLGDFLMRLLPYLGRMSRLRRLAVEGYWDSDYSVFEVDDARRAPVFSALPRTLESVTIHIIFRLECDPVDFRAYLNSQLRQGGRPGGELQRWESIEQARTPDEDGLFDFHRVLYTRQVDQCGHEYFAVSNRY